MKKIILTMFCGIFILYLLIAFSVGFPFTLDDWTLDHLLLFISGCSAIISIGGAFASFKYGG